MIIKLVALLAVLFLVYIVFFKKNRENINSKKQDEALEDIMEECPTCKVYVSRKEAILSSGKYYCSKECLK